MVHFAIVGCGGIGGHHADRLKRIAGATVTALVDIVPSKAGDFRQRFFPDAREYDSFDALLADPPDKIDAVLLCTPHTVHYPHAKAALTRGWHVLVEKPMVTNSAHAYDLWRTVNQTGKLLTIAFQAPYTAEYQCIKHLRDTGQLGKVQLVNGWLAQGWYQPNSTRWRNDPALSGGGQMYDSGAHLLNGIMWIMNEPVVEVACMYDTLGGKVDINGVAIMRFASGAMGSVAIGGNSPGWDVALNIQSDAMQLRTGPHGGFLEMKRLGRPFYPPVPFADDPLAYTPLRNFIDCLEGSAKPQVTVRHGVLLSALMDALYESADKRMPVQVRPVPEQP